MAHSYKILRAKLFHGWNICWRPGQFHCFCGGNPSGCVMIAEAKFAADKRAIKGGEFDGGKVVLVGGCRELAAYVRDEVEFLTNFAG